MQVPKLPLNDWKKLSRQVAASAQQVHKCPPCKNEPGRAMVVAFFVEIKSIVVTVRKLWIC